MRVIKGDITELAVDAIVNASNSMLLRGGGVCGAIYSKAGDVLDAYCENIVIHQNGDNNYRCKTGDAIVTPAFGIKQANYIIHAVGPIYCDGKHDEARLLRSAYVKAIMRAVECNCTSIAFPFISSGIYGYPLDECADIAIKTLNCYSTALAITMCAYSESDYQLLSDTLAKYCNS